MSIRLRCPQILYAALLIWVNAPCILGFKQFKRSEASGQSASDHSPATGASRGARPEHQSPEPSTLVQPRSGMVHGTRFNLSTRPKLATASRPSRATRSRNCLLGEGAPMRASAIEQHRDDRLAEDPKPTSHDTNRKAERTPVSPYPCRATACSLGSDNGIGKSVAEDPSRLESMTVWT
jgi:hypothetical protein